jgi:hypothetical protein
MADLSTHWQQKQLVPKKPKHSCIRTHAMANSQLDLELVDMDVETSESPPQSPMEGLQHKAETLNGRNETSEMEAAEPEDLNGQAKVVKNVDNSGGSMDAKGQFTNPAGGQSGINIAIGSDGEEVGASQKSSCQQDNSMTTLDNHSCCDSSLTYGTARGEAW